jgi:hypothetical protein
MAHGMSSTKKLVGASATFAAASEFLFRGYNVAFPEFDMGRADDLLVFSPASPKIFRLQVRSKQTTRNSIGEDGFSTTFFIPIEIADETNPLDLVVAALRYDQRWLLGLLDKSIASEIFASGAGCRTKHVGQETFDVRARVEKDSKRVFFSGIDVTATFAHSPDSKWDVLFPTRDREIEAQQQEELLIQPPQIEEPAVPSTKYILLNF